MYINYTESEAFFGDYQRVTYALSNGSPCSNNKNCLERCKNGDLVVFEAGLLNNSVFSLFINNEHNYIPWENLWGLYACFDERIGIIKRYGYCNLKLKDKTTLSFNNIEPEDFINIVKGKVFKITHEFKGYRLNYSNHFLSKDNEVETFKYIEQKLYEEQYHLVEGLTTNGICLNIIEI